MSKKLSGVWITGGSSGIGKAAAKEFARTGSQVFVSARRVRELEKLNEELEKEKLSAVVFPCNVASSVNVDQTVKKIIALNTVDCLINNAGITSFKAAEDNSVQEINDIINTNLLGSIYTIRYILPHFKKQGKGTIINILSSAAKKIFTNSSVYTASKLGLLGYSNVLREEVRKYNIRIINILPGATETPMWPSDVRKSSSDRMMTGEEVARLLVWVYLQEGNMVPEEITIKPVEGDL
ncbi:MAG: SDR family NAD(P)-dependent oxidoreductase [Ignavibacteriaceae bacterium]|nr:SDR family NAD(P)-dependent oxidoreductase [Ignavibacteriaceae bacterium]